MLQSVTTGGGRSTKGLKKLEDLRTAPKEIETKEVETLSVP